MHTCAHCDCSSQLSDLTRQHLLAARQVEPDLFCNCVKQARRCASIRLTTAMRAPMNKTSNLRSLAHGMVLGCMLVTLLSSRSLFSTGEAVAHQVRQPRRGLQGSSDPLSQSLQLGVSDMPADEAKQVNLQRHRMRHICMHGHRWMRHCRGSASYQGGQSLFCRQRPWLRSRRYGRRSAACTILPCCVMTHRQKGRQCVTNHVCNVAGGSSELML
jgi:hypothetical protein